LEERLALAYRMITLWTLAAYTIAARLPYSPTNRYVVVRETHAGIEETVIETRIHRYGRLIVADCTHGYIQVCLATLTPIMITGYAPIVTPRGILLVPDLYLAARITTILDEKKTIPLVPPQPLLPFTTHGTTTTHRIRDHTIKLVRPTTPGEEDTTIKPHTVLNNNTENKQ